MKKSDFIRSLQPEQKTLSPSEISERLRLAISCVSTYQGDSQLDIRHFRGYMVRFSEKTDKTPDNPELYTCIISTNQSKAWQDLIWTKEILQILDPKTRWTDAETKLAEMLSMRIAYSPNGNGTPPHVVADKAGLTLALGMAIPHAHRTTLRLSNALGDFTAEDLEKRLIIPSEFIPAVLDPKFAEEFEVALSECD